MSAEEAVMSEADKPVPTPPETASEALGDLHAKADADAAAAEAKVTEDRAKAAKLDEDLDKLEKEAFPERPEPVHVDQAIGT